MPLERCVGRGQGIERARQHARVVVRDHRSQRRPTRPPARDAAGDHPHPDEAERAPERRVEEIEPADTRAVDRDGATRQQAALRNEPVAVVGELEVPVREQRAGGGEAERDEKTATPISSVRPSDLGRHPVGRLAQQPLFERAGEVVGEVGDHAESDERSEDVATARQPARDEQARRRPVEDDSARWVVGSLPPRHLSPRAARREGARPPPRRRRPATAPRPSFRPRPPRPRPGRGRARGGATAPAGRRRGCDRAARPASCAEGRRARSPVARLRSGT